MQINLPGQEAFTFEGECIAKVEASNHDDTPHCAMHLYQSAEQFLCHRIDYPVNGDAWHRIEYCQDALEIYQFFGTEPLANYLYGCAGLEVPGLRNTHPK